MLQKLNRWEQFHFQKSTKNQVIFDRLYDQSLLHTLLLLRCNALQHAKQPQSTVRIVIFLKRNDYTSRSQQRSNNNLPFHSSPLATRSSPDWTLLISRSPLGTAAIATAPAAAIAYHSVLIRSLTADPSEWSHFRAEFRSFGCSPASRNLPFRRSNDRPSDWHYFRHHKYHRTNHPHVSLLHQIEDLQYGLVLFQLISSFQRSMNTCGFAEQLTRRIHIN